jgi:type II secretory pathway pseudopilin PulG
LIEMLLVMAIIALIAGSISFVVPDNRDRESARAAFELHSKIEFAREYALTRHAILALEIWPDGYRFVQWNDGNWVEMSAAPGASRALSAVTLAPELALELEVDSLDLLAQDTERDGLFDDPAERQRETGERRRGELLFIFGSGGLPVFRLSVGSDWRVLSRDGYTLKLERPDEP